MLRAFPFVLPLAMLAALVPTVARGNGSVRGQAMAGATTALATGVDALLQSAANLGLPGNPGASLELFSTRAEVANDGIGLDLYNRTTGATLSEQDKSEILAAIPNDGLTTTADVEAGVLGLQLGRVAMSVSGHAAAESNLPHEVFTLLLRGNATADSLSFDDARGEAFAMAALNLGGAVTLGARSRQPVHLGVTLRYLRGLAYARLEEVSGSLVTGLDGVRGQALAELRTAGAGQGLGLDLSLATELSARWRGSIVLENAYAQIHFDRDLELRRWVALSDTLSLATLEEVDDADELFSDEEIVEAGRPFTVTLPRVLHLALGRQGTRCALGIEWEQGFARRAGSTTRPRLGMGAEWRAIPFLPLRMGLSLGGATGRSATAGMGLALGGFRLDLAVATHGEWWPGDPKGLSVAAGSSLEF